MDSRFNRFLTWLVLSLTPFIESILKLFLLGRKESDHHNQPVAQLGEIINKIIRVYFNPSKEMDENDTDLLSQEASMGRTGKSVTSANVMFCQALGVGW